VSFTAPILSPHPLRERTMGGGYYRDFHMIVIPPPDFMGGHLSGNAIKGGLISGGLLSRAGYYPGRAGG
jgi:hypothetical protein